MELWPFIPQQGLTESLEWLTNIIRCKAGEERISLRHYPRQTYRFDCWLTPAEYGYAKVFCRENYQGFLFPMWQHYVNTGSLSWGQETIPGTFDSRIWVRDILVWDSANTWEIRTVSEVDGGLVLEAGLDRAYTDPVIIPLQEVSFAQNPEFELNNNDVRVARLRVKSIYGIEMEGTSPHPQHRGVDVLTDPNILQGSLSEQHYRDVEEIDANTGTIVINPIYAEAETESVMKWEAISRGELIDTLEWIHSRKGQRMPFWYRSHNDDLTPTSGVEEDPEDNTRERIRVSTLDGLSAPFDIVVKHPTEGEAYYRVEEIISDGIDHQYLMLDRNDELGWASNDISLSFLIGVRFGSDRVEVSYRSGGAARIAIPIVEVPGL